MVAGSDGTSAAGKNQNALADVRGWYAEDEWNVTLWGAYAFPQNDYPGQSTSRIFPLEVDKFLSSDHAWGGGIEAKRYFGRYFGIGIEAYGLAATRTVVDVEGNFGFFPNDMTRRFKDTRGIGAGLVKLVLRCPVGRSRLAPYLYAGGGFIYGGGDRDRSSVDDGASGDGIIVTTVQTSPGEEFLCQIGGGLEVRLTRRFGIVSDFSWNIVNLPRNNFGMVRSGLSIAF